MQDVEDELFGDLGVGERIVSRRDYRVEMAQEAWELWVAVTNRPRSAMPADFRREYVGLLKAKYSHDHLLRCVRGAAHLPAKPKDPRDIKRLLNVMQYHNHEAEALSLLDSGDAPIYTWEWDETEILCSALDVAMACDIEMSLWTSKEHESAGVLAQTMTADRLKFAADRVKLHLGQESLFPSELIRHRRIWNSDTEVKVKAVSGRDTYDSGERESDILNGIDLDLDVPAERLLIKGCPASLIRDYHLDAPAGYWENVLEVFEETEGSSSLEHVYDSLRGKYDWHPVDSRQAPSW